MRERQYPSAELTPAAVAAARAVQAAKLQSPQSAVAAPMRPITRPTAPPAIPEMLAASRASASARSVGVGAGTATSGALMAPVQSRGWVGPGYSAAVIPHSSVQVSPGSIQCRSSPELKALAGAVIGSIAIATGWPG